MTGIDRRTVLLAATTGLGAVLAGCGRTPDPSGPESAASHPASTSQPASASHPRSDAGRMLVVYFSRAGENYWQGGTRNLRVGNTQVLARMITEQTGAQAFRIQEADAYPGSYQATIDRNHREQDDNARPRIAGTLPDVAGHDTILLGCPVWAGKAPMIIRTFLDATDALAGRTIHPFLTYAVGQGSVFADYEQLCPEAVVADGLAIEGDRAAAAQQAVRRWVSAIAGGR